MSNQSMAGGLVQTWVPVTRPDGTTGLEAHWGESAPSHATHAA
jgi:hypothetical protein